MATTISSVKDVVREHLSRTGFPTAMLDLALAGGRRQVEQTGNYYWMHNKKTFNLVATQQDYSITTSASNGLNLPDFKDIRRLFWKKSTDNQWDEVSLSQYTTEDANLRFKTDASDTNSPQTATISNTTLTIWPVPDAVATYNMLLFYYNWTDNPVANTGSDELTTRFPEALIYGALSWAFEIELKDTEGADRWHQKLSEQIVKIRRYAFEREWLDEVVVPFATGPYSKRRARFNPYIPYAQTSY